MPCSGYLQGGLISNKGGLGLFRISQKDTLFHLLCQPSALWSNLTMRPPFFHLQKRPSSPLQFGQEENISGHTQLKGELTDLLGKLPVSSLFLQAE